MGIEEVVLYLFEAEKDGNKRLVYILERLLTLKVWELHNY